jgi:2-polyprenyl-3-methyl-5-hydroxy-6-metoxy-1,4-benzoquinol methylase
MSSWPEDKAGETGAAANARAVWDRAAAAFDEQPDHGLRDPAVRRAWTALLQCCLPEQAAAILDLGCGTGSLSMVLAGLGHHVTGIDFSPAMIALARAKAAAGGQRINFHLMDAARPNLPAGQFDVLVCRHLLWALPEPPQVLQRWLGLLRPGGRLVLIEGRWDTGAGLSAQTVLAWLPTTLRRRTVDLSRQPKLWGRPVADERYMIVADGWGGAAASTRHDR